MADLKIVKSTDNNLHRQEITKEKCIHCGANIKINIIKMPWGSDKKIKQTCKCVLDEKDAIKKRLEDTEKRRKIERLFNQSNIGEKYKNAKFEDIEQTTNNEILLKYLIEFSNNFPKHKDKSFLIFSHAGTGKSTMTSATCNFIINKYNKACIFVNSLKLVKQIQETYSYDSAIKESTILNNLKNCDLLILDDLGTEPDTKNAEEIIFTIIDDRYNHNKATIITSNCTTLESLRNRYHTRIFSRIVEMTQDRRFNLKNEKDYRLPENMKK